MTLCPTCGIRENPDGNQACPIRRWAHAAFRSYKAPSSDVHPPEFDADLEAAAEGYENWLVSLKAPPNCDGKLDRRVELLDAMIHELIAAWEQLRLPTFGGLNPTLDALHASVRRARKLVGRDGL
jgi:hypothetical protein